MDFDQQKRTSIKPLCVFLISRACGVFGLQLFACVLVLRVINLGLGPYGLSQLGLIGALSSLAFAFPIGHFVDRLKRRTAILISHFLVVIFGFTLVVFDPHHFGILLVAAASLAFTRNFRSISQFTIFGELIQRTPSKEKWINLSTLAWQISAVAAPVLAGVLGAGRISFIMASLCVGLAFFCQTYIVRFLSTEEKSIRSEGVEKDILDIGVISFLKNNFKVRSSLFLDFFVVLFAGASSLLPFLHGEHQSAFAIGMIRSALPAGILCGTLLRLHKNSTDGWVQKLTLATAGYGLCHFCLASSPYFPLSYALLFGAGIFDALSISVRECVMQFETPPAIKGRVYALNNFLVNASDELSEWESGIAAQFLGIRSAIRLSGAAAIAATCIFARQSQTSLSERRTDEKRNRYVARYTDGKA